MLKALSNLPISLAPMVGLSHVAMRDALRHYMPKTQKTIWPTEMLSSFKLPKQNLKEVSMLIKSESDVDLVPQILGNDKEAISKSLSLIKDWGAVGVDINMGCPVKKALKYNYGVSLMGDPEYAAKVVSYAVKDKTKLPVSVKFRAGLQKDESVLKDFSLGIQDAGAAWVTLHPRLSEQKRRGKADWTQIAYLKSFLKIPVVGNGDVENLKDFYSMKEQTGCDMVMIGRAMTVRPWILWQYAEDNGLELPEHLKNREAPRKPFEEGQELKAHLLRLLDLHYMHFEDAEAEKKFKFYIKVMHPWLMFGHSFYKKSTNCKTQKDFTTMIELFFSQPQSVMATTKGRY